MYEDIQPRQWLLRFVELYVDTEIVVINGTAWQALFQRKLILNSTLSRRIWLLKWSNQKFIRNINKSVPPLEYKFWGSWKVPCNSNTVHARRFKEMFLYSALDWPARDERMIPTIRPYKAKASAKMRIRIIPTKSFGCCALAL